MTNEPLTVKEEKFLKSIRWIQPALLISGILFLAIGAFQVGVSDHQFRTISLHGQPVYPDLSPRLANLFVTQEKQVANLKTQTALERDLADQLKSSFHLLAQIISILKRMGQGVVFSLCGIWFLVTFFDRRRFLSIIGKLR